MVEGMMNDTLTFMKSDGTIEKDNIRGLITMGKVITFDVTLTVQPNDRFLRKLPSGLVEEYIIEDPGYQAGVGGAIKPHFQSTVRRSDAPAAPISTIINNIVNNIHGANARININSTDNSQNIATITEGSEIFEQLRELLKGAQLSNDMQTAIELSINDLETSQGTPSFKENYGNFMSVASDHISVFAPLLASLAAML